MPDKNEFWKKYKEAVLSRLTYQAVYGQIKKQKEGTDGWVTGLCPFHNDNHSSFAFNKKTLVWACFAGCGKGSVFDFIMHSSGRDFKDTLLELGEQLNIPQPHSAQPQRPPIRENLVKRWNENLNEEVRRYLRDKRGLADETIQKYQIGWDEKRQRNTIPIRDERGNLVNIRLYNAKKDPKIINYTEGKWKYGSPARLYGLDELAKYEGKQVILCEGEFDRLLLQQEKLMAVTSTHGCSVFRPEWVEHFKGKDIVIIYDCDKEGQAAVNTIVLKAFKNAPVSSVKNVLLPLKGNKDDKDITDYLQKRGFTGGDLQRLIDDTNPHKYEEEVVEEETIRLNSFTEIEKKEYIDKRVQCEITACGETDEAFHAVEEFKVAYCPKLKKGECFDCVEPIVVKRGSKEYIGSCMSTDVQLTAMLRSLCCKYGQKPTIDVLRRTTIKEFFCHQKVNRITQTQDETGEVVQYIDGEKQELMEKKVYYLSSQNVKPGTYLAEGYVKTHPKTQQITFLIESLVPEDDEYESFDLSKNLDKLRDLQKLSWAELLEDLSENVTKVYERDEILVAILLAYCSPIHFRFNGERIRGWIVSCIIGDSGSGKTQTHTRFSEFVNVGDCFSALTGSRTGLAYALVEHAQKGWQVRIGRYPANNRKILAVDETQFLQEHDLRTIAKGMEEGFLQIDRVASKGYESKTRLILICNPKKDRVMDTFSFGCESLKSLFTPTIIRRFDLAIFANSGDIQGLSFYKKASDGPTKRKITPEMMRALIYWVWKLKEEDIIFDREAELHCLKEADRMSKVYGDATDIPLVLPSDFRKILARITVAFAALCLSEQDEFKKLVVLTDHVKMAVEFLTQIYSHDNCALDDYSGIMKAGSQITDYEKIEKAFLKKKESQSHDYQNDSTFMHTIIILRNNDFIKREDIAEQVGCSVEAIKKTVKLLKKYNLLDSTKRGYEKKPKFNKFLRRFLRSHPDFIAQEDEATDEE